MKKILRWSLIIIILCVLIYTVSGIYREEKIKRGSNINFLGINYLNNIKNSSNYWAEKEGSNLINKANLKNNENTKNSNFNSNLNSKNLGLVPEEYKGYKVAAKLKIQKLNIDTNVLDIFSQNAINVCVTKFYGPEPNEVGNFCISGHNYITKNMFGYLYKLQKGDKFTLTDNKNGEVAYKVYDKYIVNPKQTYRTFSKYKWKKRGYTNYLLRFFR